MLEVDQGIILMHDHKNRYISKNDLEFMNSCFLILNIRPNFDCITISLKKETFSQAHKKTADSWRHLKIGIVLSMEKYRLYKSLTYHNAAFKAVIMSLIERIHGQMTYSKVSEDVSTVKNTSMNPKHFIRMYWTNFCWLTVSF